MLDLTALYLRQQQPQLQHLPNIPPSNPDGIDGSSLESGLEHTMRITKTDGPTRNSLNSSNVLFNFESDWTQWNTVDCNTSFTRRTR